MKYNIVVRPDVIQLEQAVNECLAGGFIPTGGLCIWTVGDQQLFSQALVTAPLTSHQSKTGETCACSEPNIRNWRGIDLCSKCGLPLPA